MSELKKIMVIGAGDLGRRVLQELVLSSSRHVELVGRNEEATLRAANLARFNGMQRGHSPTVTYSVADLSDVDRTAECIDRFAPDVLFLAASLQSWWVITTLPDDAFRRLYAANFGPWLPMHLVPVLKAMQAVTLAGSAALVVNAAYPDAVHPVLDKIGLAPAVGIGNVANNVPAIRLAAADLLGIPVDEVHIRLIAHHYVSHRLSRFGDPGTARMDLTVLHRGNDVTAEIDVAAVLKRLPFQYRRTGGLAGQAMTAASALAVLEPLIDGRTATVHAPGPMGLPGGYPVMIDSGRVRLALPDGLSEADATAINLNGQERDGIGDIRADGSVEFTPDASAVLKRELGYDCPRMFVAEAEARARELAERFAEYRARVT